MKAIALAARVAAMLIAAHVVAADPGPAWALFFPPVPPALGTMIAVPPVDAGTPTAAAAPHELAPYISDPFYVPLGTQWAHHEIDSDLSVALQSYLSTKNALLIELRARLDSVREVAPEKRAAELRKFAADQTPRLAQLEATADGLRQTLSRRPAALQEFQRWSSETMGTAGPKTSAPLGGTPQFESQTEMMLASFGEGLNPAQRRVLRELAGEAAEPLAGPDTWAFLPEGSRVSLGPIQRLKPELQRRIADYTAADRRLKADVRSLVVAEHRFAPEPWIAAAPRQARWEAELEQQAEAIRKMVVRFKDPAMLAQVPTVPESMAEPLARHRTEKAALQRELLQRVEAAKQAGPPESAPERIRQAIADYTAANQARYQALEQSRDHLLEQLGQLAAASPGPHDPSASALTDQFNESLRQLKSFWEYRDYQSAVFQPGLSPGQRRLLLDGALIKLKLPLPGPIRPAGQR